MHLQYNDHPAPHEASLSHELLGGAAAFAVGSVFIYHEQMISCWILGRKGIRRSLCGERQARQPC
jgi:hypothetical protein